MNTPPTPPPHQPQVPARRPYGSVRLPAAAGSPASPVAPTAPAATVTPVAPRHPFRVRLPLLSIQALRSGRRDG
ncbi:hypothetical protein ABZ901_19665 [Actinacidiphila alni]|uniref:hypothetical protein n=1 Tax=Actinacidiphila alni TaxID=380248 RepID=UPI00340A4864